MKPIDTKILGDPDISIAGLKVWIFGRQFDDATDFWDANWLNVTARCSSLYSQVTTQGPIIHLSEIAQWISELRELIHIIHGEASLSCMEPELDMTIKLNKTGSGSLSVFITPDNRKERHTFTFAVDQSYLPLLLGELQTILRKHPLRGDQTPYSRNFLSEGAKAKDANGPIDAGSVDANSTQKEVGAQTPVSAVEEWMQAMGRPHPHQWFLIDDAWGKQVCSWSTIFKCVDIVNFEFDEDLEYAVWLHLKNNGSPVFHSTAEAEAHFTRTTSKR